MGNSGSRGSGSNGIHRESRSSENTVHKNKQHIDKSVALRQSGDYETALKSCDGALQANPKYLDGWNEKASVLMSKGQYEKAIECCDTAIKIDSTYFVAYNNKALSLTKLGKYDKAIECCNLAIQYMGVHNIAVKIEESNSLYLERLELYKDSAAKRDYLYNSSNVNGVNAFSWSIQNPTHGFAWFFEYSLKVSSTTPDNVRIIKNLNKNLPVYIEEVKRADYFWDQYNKYYQDMISLKGKLTLVACIYNTKAEALKKSGDYESALKYCDLALKINPTYVTVVNFKDYILREKTDFEKAVECSENMLRIKPSYQMSNFDYFLKLPCLSTVSTINLSNNQIGDDGAKLLATSLSKGEMPNLKKLQLEGNNITKEGMNYFPFAIDKMNQDIKVTLLDLYNESKKGMYKNYHLSPLGDKQIKKEILTNYLEEARNLGLDVDNIAIDRTTWGFIKNKVKVSTSFLVGFAKCLIPKDGKELLTDMAIEKNPKIIKKSIVYIQSASCFDEALDKSRLTEEGIALTKYELEVIGNINSNENLYEDVLIKVSEFFDAL